MAKKPRKPRLALVGTGSQPGATGAPPPRKLGKPGLDLWTRVQSEFSVADSGGIELLSQACEAVDRLRQVGEQIASDGGLTVRTKQGLRAHPLLREETQIRSFIVRTLRALGVTDEVVKPIGRPTTSHGWRGPLYDDQ